MTAVSGTSTPPASKGPRVSVVVPAYNAAATLRESLDSVFRQSFTDLEVIAVDEEPGQWRMTVRDNGVGIEAKDLERVFDLFQRLSVDNEEGTGIGLSICKRIVERHGGRIGVESKKGEGSAFYFTLPKSKPGS